MGQGGGHPPGCRCVTHSQVADDIAVPWNLSFLTGKVPEIHDVVNSL